MRSSAPLSTKIPPALFPLTAVFSTQSNDRDEFGQHENVWNEILTTKCLFSSAVRGAVRDFGLRKDDREHVRDRGMVMFPGIRDIPYGSRVTITWPAGLGDKSEAWRVIGTEHRPIAEFTRCPIEKMDGGVR